MPREETCCKLANSYLLLHNTDAWHTFTQPISTIQECNQICGCFTTADKGRLHLASASENCTILPTFPYVAALHAEPCKTMLNHSTSSQCRADRCTFSLHSVQPNTCEPHILKDRKEMSISVVVVCVGRQQEKMNSLGGVRVDLISRELTITSDIFNMG